MMDPIHEAIIGWDSQTPQHLENERKKEKQMPNSCEVKE